MNELQIFSNPDFGTIRTLEENGTVLFCGTDVAQALGYTNPRKAVADHCRYVTKRDVPHPQSPDKTIEMTFIPESDLYRLVFRSKLPNAEKFTDWVVEEVLPSIRKTGAYSVSGAKTAQELDAADKRATAMLLNAKYRTAQILQKLYDRAGVKPEYQALALSSFYQEDGVELPRVALQSAKVMYDRGGIAEKIGVFSKASGGKKPHAHAIGAIISLLDIREDERERLPFSSNGHAGADFQYAESVVEKVAAWLDAAGQPAPISVGGKHYDVIYKEV